MRTLTFPTQEQLKLEYRANRVLLFWGGGRYHNPYIFDYKGSFDKYKGIDVDLVVLKYSNVDKIEINDVEVTVPYGMFGDDLFWALSKFGRNFGVFF